MEVQRVRRIGKRPMVVVRSESSLVPRSAKTGQAVGRQGQPRKPDGLTKLPRQRGNHEARRPDDPRSTDASASRPSLLRSSFPRKQEQASPE